MNLRKLLWMAGVGLVMMACTAGEVAREEVPGTVPVEESVWEGFDVGRIQFHNNAPETPGGRITGAIVRRNPRFFEEIARKVVGILYFSPDDSIQRPRNLNVRLENFDGVAYATGDEEGSVIAISCRWIGNSFLDDVRDTARVEREITGVMLHEMTHVYQLEPRAPGGYGGNAEVWACVEGTADAVRYLAGFFEENEVGAGGSYLNGYRETGFFLGWVQKNKDADFLRAFNRAALNVYPWNFRDAFVDALGEGSDVDVLWEEYQVYRRGVK
jgi:hypothetical protein